MLKLKTDKLQKYEWQKHVDGLSKQLADRMVELDGILKKYD